MADRENQLIMKYQSKLLVVSNMCHIEFIVSRQGPPTKAMQFAGSVYIFS